ncbi:GroES-like protein [Testicularia cyperi]|uniref:GroES-like protein n=1 Tax=Testicularia cyperi TaxID=1882483 RepID=A0A317XXS2_9BASI|nr:GroES-like protein [Testicularia cyperi]
MSTVTIPTTTEAYRLRSFSKDLNGLVLDTSVSLPRPEQLRPKQVLVRIHAVSLNARDYQIATATYPAPTSPPAGLIPVSDGAGEILAVGPDVTNVKVGDRVVTHMCAPWTHGEIGNEMQATALGGGVDGVLARHAVLDQGNVLVIPDSMSFREASTLPVAGLTAFHCLFGFSKTVQPGQTVLIEGTGGVSLAALQLTLSAGARPIVISSSDEKLSICQQLGAAPGDCINYSTDKKWWETVKALTHRAAGVDHTIEIAGGRTMIKALMCTKAYGSMWVVGYMDDYKSSAEAEAEADDGLPDPAKAVLYSQAHIQGVMCGSYALFQQFLEAHRSAHLRFQQGLASTNILKPYLPENQIFAFQDAKRAFEVLGSGRFVGKIVIDVD